MIPDWDRVSPWIEAALEYADGAYLLEDIEAAIEAGDMLLLASDVCAVVVEIMPFPRLKALNVLLAGGDLAEIKSLDPVLVEIAQGHGCRRIYLSGRRGWLRTLKDLGYGDLSATASKEV